MDIEVPIINAETAPAPYSSIWGESVPVIAIPVTVPKAAPTIASVKYSQNVKRKILPRVIRGEEAYSPFYKQKHRDQQMQRSNVSAYFLQCIAENIVIYPNGKCRPDTRLIDGAQIRKYLIECRLCLIKATCILDVEGAGVSRILASDTDIDARSYQKMRGLSMDEVKRTNGRIDFEDALLSERGV
mgnify:CR=1 FL=1